MDILLLGGDIFLGIVIVTWLLQWLVPPLVIKVDAIFFSRQYAGLSVLFFVFIRRDSFSDTILRHEFAHYRQQRFLSPIGLAVFLLFHYLILYIKHRSVRAVYQNSVIEKQANDQMRQNRPLPYHIRLN